MNAEVRPVYSQAAEDYIKAIFELEQNEANVSTTGLAHHLSATPAAVTKMVKHLAERQLAKHTPYYGVQLTPAGRLIALELIRHHRLLELYLQKALGYAWDEVDAEAEKLEHHISEELEERIDRILDHPCSDPHGDPIPTRDGQIAPSPGVPLSQTQPGDLVVIRRVSDRNPEALRYLTQIGLGLGSELEILEKQPFNGPIILSNAGTEHALGLELAGIVFVEPLRKEAETP